MQVITEDETYLAGTIIVPKTQPKSRIFAKSEPWTVINVPPVFLPIKGVAQVTVGGR